MFSSNTSQVSGGYEIQRSLRFNSADSAFLNRTPASAGNRQRWTWSGWVKRSSLNTFQYFFNASPDSFNNTFSIASFGAGASEDQLRFQDFQGGSQVANIRTTAVFRDVSAWYHIVLAADTTQATDTNRFKMYVNGVQITAFSVASYPAQNADLTINNNVLTTIGYITTTNNFNGYMTEVNFIDGQALTPSSFGAFDAQTGVWGPTRYGGSYGTNGFYLNFSDNSNTTAATLGKDYSGNSNNWTPNNFSVSAGAGNDSLVDVPTNWGTDTGVGGSVRGNYCTLNPLGTAGAIPTNGNLAVSSSSTVGNRISTILLTSGKWYWEGSGNGYVGAIIGVDGGAFTGSISATGSKSIGYWWDGGLAFWDGGNSGTGTGYNSTDIIGVALDMDIGNVKFYKNNTLIHNLTFGSGTVPNLSTGVYAGYNVGANTTSVDFNFGQRPFAYTAPSGFRALNTQNLPTPTIGATTATQANKYFDVVLRNGGGPTGGTYSTTINMANGAWLWDKPRNQASSNYVVDSVRGLSRFLSTNQTIAEETIANWFIGFNNGSFTTGTNDWGSGVSIVDWIWAANGAGVTNTAGSITSTVSANTTSGFSVVTYTGNGTSGATIGHGLSATPRMIIVKRRNSTSEWLTYTQMTGNTNFLELNTTAASFASSSAWNNTSPTSSVFSVGNASACNASGSTYVAYAFAEVPGYSSFGSYTGNGSSDGPFVFCGFRPAYILFKRSSGTGDWGVFDVKRNTFNSATNVLFPNLSNAEVAFSAGLGVDILSNGFKIRSGPSDIFNASGSTHIFAAFAEMPQKFALAR